MIAGYVIAASLYLFFVACVAVMPDEWIMSATKAIVSFSIWHKVIEVKRDEKFGDAVAVVEVDYRWYGAILLGAWTATVRFAAWLRSW